MKQQVTPELLHKYLDGKCTQQELFLLYRWYDSFEDYQNPIMELTAEEQSALEKLMLDNFKASIPNINNIPQFNKTKKPIFSKWIMTGVAATVLLVCGLYVNTVKKASYNSNVANEAVFLSNHRNTIHRQLLSDGSVVWLNPKSSLQYPRKFQGTFREVKMTGEAFFEIKKDHAHPFVIYSGGVVTRVWGTSFRIRAYNNIPTEVSVISGEVSVKIPTKENSEVMLLPKQKATFFKNNLSLAKSNELNPSMRRWQKTTLSFDNVPLQNVFNKLNKYYGVRIYTSDNHLGRYLFKADFTDQSLPAILDMMESSLNVNYVLDNDEIVIYKNGDLNQ